MKTTLTREKNPKFKFWVGNNVDMEVSFYISDIKKLFKIWLSKQDKVWIENTSSEMAIRFFIATKHGLNSTFEEADFNELYSLLKPDYLNFK